MKALVVIDMQNDFVTGSLGSEAAQKIVPNVVAKVKQAKENGDAIIFTQDTHFSNYLCTEEGINLPIEHCRYGTIGWDIINELKPYVHRASDIWTKETFGSTIMAQSMGNLYESIEVIGLYTDVCVVSNVLLPKAFNPNVPIYVDAACCAGTTPEAHDAAIKTMKSCQIHILNEGKEPWRNDI